MTKWKNDFWDIYMGLKLVSCWVQIHLPFVDILFPWQDMTLKRCHCMPKFPIFHHVMLRTIVYAIFLQSLQKFGHIASRACWFTWDWRKFPNPSIYATIMQIISKIRIFFTLDHHSMQRLTLLPLRIPRNFLICFKPPAGCITYQILWNCDGAKVVKYAN